MGVAHREEGGKVVVKMSVCRGGNGSCTKTEESTEGSQTQTLGLRMSRVKVVGRQLRGCGQAWSCGGQVGERNDMIGVA